MTHESPAQGRASTDAQDVEEKRTATVGHGGTLTAKQRKRFPAGTVEAILARPPATAQAHDLALSLGKVMRRDGTFEPLRDSHDMLCAEVRPFQRDKVLVLLNLSAWSWGEYVRQWKAAGLAHACAGMKRGSIRLFLEPAAVCPVPSCGEGLPTATVKRGSQQRAPLPTTTETVLSPGDASRDEKGVVPVAEASTKEPHQGQGSEVAAFAALKRVGATIGEPLTDDEVLALGYRSTRRGWVPVDAA